MWSVRLLINSNALRGLSHNWNQFGWSPKEQNKRSNTIQRGLCFGVRHLLDSIHTLAAMLNLLFLLSLMSTQVSDRDMEKMWYCHHRFFSWILYTLSHNHSSSSTAQTLYVHRSYYLRDPTKLPGLSVNHSATFNAMSVCDDGHKFLFLWQSLQSSLPLNHRE